MIRPYSHQDKPKLIELIKQNIPAYFAPSEEIDFEHYLDHEVEDYFVFEEHSQIIGCGGINYFNDQKMARLSWDIIAPNSQGKGIGKALMLYRIKLLNKNPKIKIISVRTSQLAYKFYEKMGFELEKVITSFWAENFDLYQMQMTNENPRDRPRGNIQIE